MVKQKSKDKYCTVSDIVREAILTVKQLETLPEN
jgi:uncharacterized OsmC-like protein